MIKGDLTASEPETAMKGIVAVAAATSGPVTALFFDGSVVGLSAAGLTSGLAALGLGGVVGVSAMVTGIGAVIVLGVAADLLAHRAMGGKERELANKRGHMIQQIVKQHQDSVSELAADLRNIAARMEEYTSRSERNEETLASLKSELRLFKDAPGALEDRREQYASTACRRGSGLPETTAPGDQEPQARLRNCCSTQRAPQLYLPSFCPQRPYEGAFACFPCMIAESHQCCVPPSGITLCEFRRTPSRRSPQDYGTTLPRSPRIWRLVGFR